MKPFGKLIVGTAVLLGITMGTAAAVPTTVSFAIQGVGAYTVNTGDIALTTATKTIPLLEGIGGVSGANVAAGIFPSGPVTFSTYTLDTDSVGPIVPFSVTAGFLTMTFTDIVLVSKVASTASSSGSLDVQYNGTVVADTSVGTLFLGQTVSLSEACTQGSTAAVIACTESVVTPGLPVPGVPEPATLALLGAGVAALGVVRRRRP